MGMLVALPAVADAALYLGVAPGLISNASMQLAKTSRSISSRGSARGGGVASVESPNRTSGMPWAGAAS